MLTPTYIVDTKAAIFEEVCFGPVTSIETSYI